MGTDKRKVKKSTLVEAVATTQVRPTMAAILDHYFTLIGGPEAFAKQLHDEYKSAPPGSLARTKIIDILSRGLKAEDAKAGLGDDLGMLGDEDLNRELRRREELIRPYLREATDGDDGPGRPEPPGEPGQPPVGGGPPAPAAPAAAPAGGPPGVPG